MNTFRTLINKISLLEASANQVDVYHGTNQQFDDISLYQGAAYFTNNPEVAKSYGNIVKEFRLTLSNPAIVYANGENWNTILMFNKIEVANKQLTVGELLGIDDDYEMVEASTIAHELNQKFNVNCVIFKDIIDTGANIETFVLSNVYVIFDTLLIQKV